MQTKHEIRPADGFPGREHREAATRRWAAVVGAQQQPVLEKGQPQGRPGGGQGSFSGLMGSSQNVPLYFSKAKHSLFESKLQRFPLVLLLNELAPCFPQCSVLLQSTRMEDLHGPHAGPKPAEVLQEEPGQHKGDARSCSPHPAGPDARSGAVCSGGARPLPTASAAEARPGPTPAPLPALRAP